LSRLAQAPLIEVVFELRWGEYSESQDGTTSLSFDPDEARFFPGIFGVLAHEAGFEHVEHIDAELHNLPHIATIRFRPGENLWPCYQIGLGILTVNQANDGYDWETYKESILRAVSILRSASRFWDTKSFPGLIAELTYRDGFFFEEEETSFDFLQHNLQFRLSPPESFLSDDRLAKKVDAIEFSFELEVSRPMGRLIMELDEVTINGRPGFAMDTSVQSSGTTLLLEEEPLLDWLEAAHDLQRHAFKTLINPTYARRFNG